jgi:4-amino-4-deoxy-L-arabinose transferase-like glycosyltransferase
VYQLYLKYKDKEILYLLPFVLLSLHVRLRYLFYLQNSGKGFPQSEDSQWYIQYAYALMNDFKIGLHMNDLMYIGYNVLLTVLLAIFKDPVTIIFIQAIAAGLGVILVYLISLKLFNRTTAVLASFFYCNYSWGITMWSAYILSDSFFITLLLICVYFLLMFMESGKRFYKIGFIASAVYMLVFRPTGIVSVFFIAIYVLINLPEGTVSAFIRKYKLVLAASAAAAVATVLYVFMSDTFTPLVTSMQFNAKKVLYNIYANGWIYDQATPYDHHFKPDYTINICNSLILSFLINNWDHVLVLYGKRMLAFLGKWVWDTNLSSVSGILRLAEHIFPLFLFAAGIADAFIVKRFRRSSIIWLLILAVFMFCIIFFIDAMYRYKAPGLPFIAIAVAYGASSVIRWAILIVKKYVGKLLLWKKKKYSL